VSVPIGVDLGPVSPTLHDMTRGGSCHWTNSDGDGPARSIFD